MIPPNVKEVLKHQHYRLVGEHSAVKLCHWTKRSIRGDGFCYKQQFYGIKSHRCLQMTPAVSWCTQKCVFCWRNTEQTLGTKLERYDDPDLVGKKTLEEAKNPNQAAISLSGEPTVYPDINGLLDGFRRRKFTTFLVTNGTLPERLEGLDSLPTQLYLSVDGPDKETYKKVCNPLIPDGWERFNKTLELFPSLDTKTAIRVTLVKDVNMKDPAGFAKLIEKAEPDYVEVKAYMFVGSSRARLSLDNMPTPDEVMGFSERLAEECGYVVKDSKRESRVVLLTKK